MYINDIYVSNILSTYASTVKYFITYHVLLNYVSLAPIIKFADLHKACQTSKGGKCPVGPPSGCATGSVSSVRNLTKVTTLYSTLVLFCTECR